MSYLILNGMYEEDSFIPLVEKIVVEEFKKRNINGETIVLHKQEIKPCIGCFKCWVQTPGICIIDDYARNVTKTKIQSDVAVYISPVTFGGYSAELKKAIDREIGLISPFFRVYKGEIHHETRYDKYPDLLVIGTLQEPDKEQEEIFTELVERNILNNFAPRHNTQIIYHSENEEEITKKICEGLDVLGDENV